MNSTKNKENQEFYRANSSGVGQRGLVGFLAWNSVMSSDTLLILVTNSQELSEIG